MCKYHKPQSFFFVVSLSKSVWKKILLGFCQGNRDANFLVGLQINDTLFLAE